VLKLAKEKVLKWIDEHPDVPIIDVSQNDGNGPCECDECTRIVSEEGSQQGPILRFVNAIADEVAEKHPGKWIETLAYAYSTKPPAVTRPRSNVIIRLCHAGCYYHGFEQCGMNANFAGYLDEWSSVTRRIFIWHYGTNFLHYLAPNPNLAGLARDIRFYASHGVNGLMVQCNYQGPGGELAELRQYLAAQLMWDPSQDPTEIRRDFCTGYYGKASDDVLQFLALMDRVAEQPEIHAFGAWDPTTTVKPQFVEDALGVLDRARTAADNQTIRNRVEKLMLPFWYMKLSFPAKYGLSDKEAPALWRRARRVMIDNRITHVREGDPNAAAWIAEIDARLAPRPKDLVCDLVTRIDEAETTNCADWRVSGVRRDGRLARTVFQHPEASNDGDATYEIALPPAKRGKKPVLKFGTVISNKTRDGVRFAVLVNGKVLWSATKTTFALPEALATQSLQDSILPGNDPFSDHSLNLEEYAGQTILLTLRVHAVEDSTYDWANWVEPRIMMVK
jgi:hypothetical protein